MTRARARRRQRPSVDAAAAVDLQAPAPLGKLFAWLDFQVDPELALNWPRHFLRAGDEVEVSIAGKHGGATEVVGRCRVVSANGVHFKLADGRVFSQADGSSLLSGRRSPVRARRAT